jgi:hypothetical protein
LQSADKQKKNEFLIEAQICVEKFARLGLAESFELPGRVMTYYLSTQGVVKLQQRLMRFLLEVTQKLQQLLSLNNNK